MSSLPFSQDDDGGAELVETGDQVTVLVVDDDAEFAAMTSEFLESENPDFEPLVETSPDAVPDSIESEEVDCVVCDFDMPGLDGLELLRHIRETHPSLPFILFTGKGSEEIASEAVSAGVTDYLQKRSGVEQYAVLANRIDNAVRQYHAERVLDRVGEFHKLIKYATDVISIVDENGVFQYLPPSSERILGYEPEVLVGEVGFDYIHPDDRDAAVERFAHCAQHPDELVNIEFRFDHPDGWIWLESRARNMVEDPDIQGFVVYSRDITDRKRRERQNERLQQFATTVSHDLKNPLSVANGRLEMLAESGDDSHIDHIRRAHERMENIIDELLTLAMQGAYIENQSPVHLPEAARDAWQNVTTREADLVTECDRRIVADPNRIHQLLENLFANAVEHGGEDVSVRVGTTERGFFVADDGVGIPEEERERVFDSGYTTAEDGIGFGLTIVEEITTAHGWDVAVEVSDGGGTRFTFEGVEEG